MSLFLEYLYYYYYYWFKFNINKYHYYLVPTVVYIDTPDLQGHIFAAKRQRVTEHLSHSHCKT